MAHSRRWQKRTQSEQWDIDSARFERRERERQFVWTIGVSIMILGGLIQAAVAWWRG